MFVRNITGGWALHSNNQKQYPQGGLYVLRSWRKVVGYAEDWFSDTCNPTKDEVLLFLLEHGEGDWHEMPVF